MAQQHTSADSVQEVAENIAHSSITSSSLPQPNLHWKELRPRSFAWFFWVVLLGAAVLTSLSAMALVCADLARSFSIADVCHRCGICALCSTLRGPMTQGDS